jgi:hypothetical protein
MGREHMGWRVGIEPPQETVESRLESRIDPYAEGKGL